MMVGLAEVLGGVDEGAERCTARLSMQQSGRRWDLSDLKEEVGDDNEDSPWSKVVAVEAETRFASVQGRL